MSKSVSFFCGFPYRLTDKLTYLLTDRLTDKVIHREATAPKNDTQMTSDLNVHTDTAKNELENKIDSDWREGMERVLF